MPLAGEAAALLTACCWATVSLLFTTASRRVGAFTVNVTRITLALPLLGLLVWWTQPAGWHEHLDPRSLGLLAASGWLGLTLGDWALFSAFALIGPRLATVMMTLTPPLAALLAVPLLGEHLAWGGILGMAVTLGGVAWVVLERAPVPIARGHRLLGGFLAFLGAAGQAAGLVLSKLGMGDSVDPVPATLIRMIAAALGVWAIAAARDHLASPLVLLRNRAALAATVGATVLGPVIGVSLSLVAVRLTDAGIAATLMAPVPVFVLPLVRIVYGERISPRALLGGMVAVAGVAVLLLR